MDNSEVIKEFIVNNFLFGDSSGLDFDTDFFEAGIIDSTGIIELVSFIEETYNISVEDEELTRINFSTINNIVKYVQAKIGRKVA